MTRWRHIFSHTFHYNEFHKAIAIDIKIVALEKKFLL